MHLNNDSKSQSNISIASCMALNSIDVRCGQSVCEVIYSDINLLQMWYCNVNLGSIINYFECKFKCNNTEHKYAYILNVIISKIMCSN